MIERPDAWRELNLNKAVPDMNLLSSPAVIETLDDIRANFSVAHAPEGSALDRFFWLHGTRGPDPSAPLRIYPSFRSQAASDAMPVRLCNLVLQGGGTLGLAHAGFVTGLEAAGVRFVGLAGTSAGSILAMGIAAIRGHDITQATHPDLVALADTAPMDHFIDGPRPLRVLIKRMLKGGSLAAPHRWPACIAALIRLRDRRGLNPGTAFETWFSGVLAAHGCRTIDDLLAALAAVWDDLGDLRQMGLLGPDCAQTVLHSHAPDTAMEQHPSTALLQLISMAMPVGMKFKLPQDLYYLSPEYQRITPARLVRTSMSIPAFFDPVVMQTNGATWRQRVKAEVSDLMTASQSAHFEDLKELVFLDGGMMSNLPSDSFRELMPQVPTIVVPLVNGTASAEITRRHKLADLATDIGACISAVRLQRDRETWAQNGPLRAAFDQAEKNEPDVRSKKRAARRYPVEIAPIDTGEANWLNFVMSATEKADLFYAGLLRAHALLKTLNAGDKK